MMLPVPKYTLGTRWVEVLKKRKYWFGYKVTLEKRHVVYWTLPDRTGANVTLAIAECFHIVDAYEIVDALLWKNSNRPDGRNVVNESEE